MTAGTILSLMLRAIPWSVRDRIKNIPGIAQAQRAVFSLVFDGREIEHRLDAGPAKGITFAIKLPDDKGIWTGIYEVDFAKHVAAAVKPGSATYDIGSWHGFFAGVMAAQGAAQVHAFEPLPQNIDRIRRMIVLNPDKTVLLHSCAVGNADTEMDLVIMPDTSMAKLEASSFQMSAMSKAKLRVKVRAIDSIVAAGEAPPPSLMKIDVEGAELMVLEGARETIRAHRPAIFAEMHSAELLSQCTDFLAAENYQVEILDADLAAAKTRDVFQIQAVSRSAK